MSNKKDESKEILPDISNIKTQETFTLPSKGLVYDERDNIPASITLRRMTTKEEKIRMRNNSEDLIRRDLLQACIVEDIDAGRLKLIDANFLLFRLRVLSLLDDNYKVECVCKNCGTVFIHEVNLSEVPVNYLTKKDLDEMLITLPLSKQKIQLKYPSLSEMIIMGEKLRDYFTKFPNADRRETLYTTSAMLYIDKVNDEHLISEELEDYVDKMDIIDNRYFRKAITTIDSKFGLSESIATQCPTCHKEFTHGLPITGELFNPSL